MNANMISFWGCETNPNLDSASGIYGVDARAMLQDALAAASLAAAMVG